jgi:hypothetical protein
MRKKQFIEAIYQAGWLPRPGANTAGIEKLWRECFPAAAELEEDYNHALVLAQSRAETIKLLTSKLTEQNEFIETVKRALKQGAGEQK